MAIGANERAMRAQLERLEALVPRGVIKQAYRAQAVVFAYESGLVRVGNGPEVPHSGGGSKPGTMS